MIEFEKILAKLQREAYLARLGAGFTPPKQALELVKGIKL